MLPVAGLLTWGPWGQRLGFCRILITLLERAGVPMAKLEKDSQPRGETAGSTGPLGGCTRGQRERQGRGRQTW